MRGRSRLRRIALLFICVVALGSFALPQVFLKPLASLFVVRDELLHGDAIVVLLGGDMPDRVLKAHELYARGVAPKIVFGSGFVDRALLADTPKGFRWVDGASRMKVAFKSLGVPDADVLVLDSSGAYDTSGELAVVASYATAEHWSRVILVSSAVHSRRVQGIWHRVGRGIADTTIGADDGRLDDWWHHERLARDMVYEAGALLKELLRRGVYLFRTEQPVSVTPPKLVTVDTGC